MAQQKFQEPQNAVVESKRADGRGHQPKGIARQIAEATGLSVDTVRRALNQAIQRAAHHTWVGAFGIADLPGFVDFLVRQADVGGGNRFCIGSGFGVVRGPYVPSLLRRVILIRQPPLRRALDVQRVSLRVHDRDDDFIVRLLGLRDPALKFGSVIRERRIAPGVAGGKITAKIVLVLAM